MNLTKNILISCVSFILIQQVYPQKKEKKIYNTITFDSPYTYYYKGKIDRENSPENAIIQISITEALSFFGEKDKGYFRNFKIGAYDNTILQRLRISGPCKSSDEYGKPFLKNLFLDEDNVYKVILKTNSLEKEYLFKAKDLNFRFKKKSVTIKLPKISF